MTIQQIKSDKVRAYITGSATPFSDICADSTLTPAELDEAQAYAFTNHRCGIIQLANAERTFGISRDI